MFSSPIFPTLMSLESDTGDNYLKGLISFARNILRTGHPNLQFGVLVLIKHDLSPPATWPLARVIAVYPGPGSDLRVATLQTANATFQWTIVKLCLLPVAVKKKTPDNSMPLWSWPFSNNFSITMSSNFLWEFDSIHFIFPIFTAGAWYIMICYCMRIFM